MYVDSVRIVFVKCFFDQVTDASMLTITGFPAFAVGDDSLRNLTKEMVLESLEVIIENLSSLVSLSFSNTRLHLRVN